MIAIDRIMDKAGEQFAKAREESLETFADKMALTENRQKLIDWLTGEPFPDLALGPTFPGYVKRDARWLAADPLNSKASADLLKALRTSLGLAVGDCRHLYTDLARDEHARAIAAVKKILAKQKARRVEAAE